MEAPDSSKHEAEKLLEQYLRSDDVSEIHLSGLDRLFIRKAEDLYRLQADFQSLEQYSNFVNRILENSSIPRRINPDGTMVDGGNPIIDTAWVDPETGNRARVNIITKPCTLEGPVVTICKLTSSKFGFDDLVERGSMTTAMATFIEKTMRARCNLLIGGNTGAGKTTLANVILKEVFRKSPEDKVVIIEDTPELTLDLPTVTYIQAYENPVDPFRSVGLELLTRNAKRMRPDRLIVGEVRGGEATHMLAAMRSGSEGSLCTIHSNSTRSALDALVDYCCMSNEGGDKSLAGRTIESTIDLVVQLQLLPDRKHRTIEIAEVDYAKDDYKFITRPIFSYDEKTDSHKVGVRPSERFIEKLKNRGVEVVEDMFRRNFSL